MNSSSSIVPLAAFHPLLGRFLLRLPGSLESIRLPLRYDYKRVKLTRLHSSYSAMSSATADAESSVSYVTDVQTIRASSSASSTAKPEDVTAMATVFETASVTGNSTADAASSKADSEDSGGLSTGVIIGISVAGGVVVLAIALFIIWKLKQKRFDGYDDDGAYAACLLLKADRAGVVDGIKWPELNRHGESSTMNLPLPAKPTGGHGFETNALVSPVPCGCVTCG